VIKLIHLEIRTEFTVKAMKNIEMIVGCHSHAVFAYPQIASVGLTEDDARKLSENVLVGKAYYRDVARGLAMMENHGFAKAVLQKDTGKILGFHIIGPHASILIQEVVNALATTESVFPVMRGIHIHPALSEVVQAALENIEEPLETGK
jgi:mycothione reductase